MPNTLSEEASRVLCLLLYPQHWVKCLQRISIHYIFSNHHGNATQNHNDISPQTCRGSCFIYIYIYFKIASIGEVEEKLNPCTLYGKCKNGAATMENRREVPQKIKTRTAILPSNPHFWIFTQKNKSKYCE